MTEQPPVQLDELLEDEDTDQVGNLAVFPDNPPKSGVWVDVDEMIASATLEEMEAGRKLGESIDIDNDEDSGDE